MTALARVPRRRTSRTQKARPSSPTDTALSTGDSQPATPAAAGARAGERDKLRRTRAPPPGGGAPRQTKDGENPGGRSRRLRARRRQQGGGQAVQLLFQGFPSSVAASLELADSHRHVANVP